MIWKTEGLKLFYPKSSAVFGVSTDTTKFGTLSMNTLIQFGFNGKIYPINPHAKEVLGLKTYNSLSEIHDPIDLALVAVPASAVPSVLKDCGEKGVTATVVYTSGFSETGKEKGIRIIGPNCFGIYCPACGLTLPLGAHYSKESGDVAFLSQSGGCTDRLCLEAKGWGIRFSKVVSYGNACDLMNRIF